MKYIINKIKSFSAINDMHGLGKDKANLLKDGKSVELIDPPKDLVDGGYLKEVSTPKGGKK